MASVLTDMSKSLDNNDSEESAPKKLKSGPSMVQSFVRFVNRTIRQVDVVWLNYEGIGVHYRSLAPNHWVDVNTYVGHPWIFRDSETGDKLVVQLQEVFEPPRWNTQNPPTRKVFNITIPGMLTTLGWCTAETCHAKNTSYDL